MNVLETHDLGKRYGRHTAIDRLNLTVRGGATGLLGPNGAGKSTLVKIVMGLVAPSAGRATVLGLDSARDGLRIREQIGYMPEHESLIPGLDAVRYVTLAGRLVGMPRAAAVERTHVVLNYVGIDEQRYRKIDTYSTGMKQKVKLAQALVHHPRLLLLDEPTAGLDPRGRAEMLDLIRDVSRKKGIQVILSTHILPDVEAVCDDVAILDRGALVREGPLAELGRTGDSGGPSFDVEVRGGDRDRFLVALAAMGSSATIVGDDTLRVTRKTPGDAIDGDGSGVTTSILKAAVEAGAQVRRLSRSRSSLEDLFARLVVESRSASSTAPAAIGTGHGTH